MCENVSFGVCLLGQPVSENSVFPTTYIHKQTVKTMISYKASH